MEGRTIVLGPGDIRQKKRYAGKVYGFLYETYKAIGGIDKGSGFKDKDDMTASIPLWRLRMVNNKIVSAMMFKVNSHGKKMVAYAAAGDLSQEMKRSDFNFMLNSSYAELSGALLVTILKQFPRQLHRFVLRADRLMRHKRIYPLTGNISAAAIPGNSKRIFERLKGQWPELIRFCYIRKIGNENKIKLMLGTIGQAPLKGQPAV